MATIRRLRGRWQAQVRRRGLPPRAKSFDLKSDAERWARNLESQLDRGAFGIDTRKAEQTTVRELLARYKAEITPQKRGAIPEAVKINGMMKSDIAHYTLATLTSEVVAQYRDMRLLTVTPGTINRDLSILSHAIEIARREWGIHVLENPVRQIRRPSAAKGRQRRLEGNEEALLLEAARASRNRYIELLIIFAIETGMRRGEMLSLRWSSINTECRYAHLDITKNGDPRDVPLSRRALAVLQSVKELQRSKEFDKDTNDSFVFDLTRNAARKAWVRTVERAGIEGLTFHDLRHEATSRMFERGLDAMEVSSISGHRSFKMLRRYTHLRAEGLAERLG
ncbi:integrase [Hwanghaeella sp. LZ110]|uniref:integrase n=1 Tax=Hwanghaeella sp. LZ110 TaxID=3402810 RepID=UPI003B670CA2